MNSLSTVLIRLLLLLSLLAGPTLLIMWLLRR